MTLQQDWENEASASTVTSIFGYNENEGTRRSAIPLFFDEWFHGDFKTERPNDESNATGTKSLEEYAEDFPEYRLHSVVEIGFDSTSNSVDNYEVQTTDPDDDTTSGKLARVTLEGGSDEPENPFRNEYDHYDDDQDGDYLPASQKGPYSDDKIVEVESENGEIVEGVRASLIFGGRDKYLEKVKEDITDLSELVNYDVAWTLALYFSNLPAFYTFIDFVFMADGMKLVRVWDASVYPAHALHVEGDKKRQNTFREGVEWTTNGSPWENEAFNRFAVDGQLAEATPFGGGGTFGYKEGFWLGSGEHSVMDYDEPGSTLSRGTVEDQLSDPFFPF